MGNYIQLILVSIVSLGSGLILTPLSIIVAKKLGIVDVPDARKVHTRIVTRMGGTAIVSAYLIGLLVYYLISGSQEIANNFPLILGGVCIFFLGLADDLMNLPAKFKFLVQSAIAVFVISQGLVVESVQVPFIGYTVEFGWVGYVLTFFWVVGVCNAINLLDGLDGLAGSISIVILSTLLILGFMNNDILMISWSSILIAVITAFMFFNWNPAKVFMGDSGSLLIGFIISLLSIRALEYVNAVAILFLVAVPVLDTLIVFTRRIQRGDSPFKADRNHLHHVLFDMKRNKSLTVKLLFTIQLVFSALFLQLNNQNDMINLSVFALLFVIFFNLFEPRSVAREKRKSKNDNTQKNEHQSNRKNRLSIMK